MSVLVGQKTLDIFGFSLSKKPVILNEAEPGVPCDEEFLKSENTLEKQFRLARVKVLRKPFLELRSTHTTSSVSYSTVQIRRDELSCGKSKSTENNSQLVSQDVYTIQSMCAYDAAEQESGVYKLVSAGMVRGGVVGSHASYAASQDINENRNIFDREKCVRNSDAICDVLAIQAQNRNRHAKPRMHGSRWSLS